MLCILAIPGNLYAADEARYGLVSEEWTLNPDGSREYRYQMELTLFTHTAMNNTYGETFIAYDPKYQQLKINEAYTKQKDGTIIRTPENAFVEVLPSYAADAAYYNRLKEMVVVHTGLELGATIYLDYTIQTKAGYLDNQPRRGFRVRGFDRQRALEVFEVIGPLDGQAAFLACPQLTEQDLAQMQFLVGSMDLAISSGLILKYDDLQREFHYSYVQKCGNQRLMDLMTQLERCFIKRDYSTVDREMTTKLLLKANEEHRHILDLLKARDAAAVRDYVRDVHWDTDNAEFTVW